MRRRHGVRYERQHNGDEDQRRHFECSAGRSTRGVSTSRPQSRDLRTTLTLLCRRSPENFGPHDAKEATLLFGRPSRRGLTLAQKRARERATAGAWLR